MDTDRNIHNQHKKKHTHKHKHTERPSSITQTQANARSLNCELSVQDFMDMQILQVDMQGKVKSEA